jgi:molybdopterin converting factor small subunit
MTTLRIPTPLRTYTSGKSEVIVTGAKISEALTDLTAQFPAIKPHLFNEGGELRPFVNLFVGEHNIKDLQGVDTPIKDGDKIMLIPSIAGGKSLNTKDTMGTKFLRTSPLCTWCLCGEKVFYD